MLMMEKVGEWTPLGMPKPFAMPFTSWVLPAPRTPLRPTIQPRAAAFPHSAPMASVAAGSFEVSVTMGSERPSSILIAKRDSLAGGHFSDATQLNLGKLLFPIVQQRHRVPAGNAKQQFEIFTVR